MWTTTAAAAIMSNHCDKSHQQDKGLAGPNLLDEYDLKSSNHSFEGTSA